MCIITGETRHVNNTKIFAAMTPKKTHQLTVYSNRVGLLQGQPVAMILPVPNGEKGVKFVDLSGYTEMFDEIDAALFPDLSFRNYSESFGQKLSADNALPVYQVGSYKVSFAETLSDLTRLRFDVFQLPPNIRQLLEKTYSSGRFGFVVCILDRDANFHPFGYLHTPLSDGTLWIPTKHQHGAHYEEMFSDWDHAIYSTNTLEEGGRQGDLSGAGGVQWNKLPSLDTIRCVRKLEIVGQSPNRDLVLRVR